MMKLKIVERNNHLYKLVDKDNKEYIICLSFLDIEEKPEVGNYIYINKNLLDSNYGGFSTSYTFGNLDNKYGKDNILLDDTDVIKIVISDKEILLKRLYG